MPAVGLLLASLGMPYGTMLILEAGATFAERREMRWGIIKTYFADRQTRNNFVFIGLFYYLVIFSTDFAYTVLAQDSIAAWAVNENNRLLWESVLEHMPWGALCVSLAIFFAGQMALFFAPMLIALKKLTFGKALFFSFFACAKHLHLFLILGVIWLLTCAAFGFFSAWLTQALNIGTNAGYVVIPVGILILCVLYGTMYPIWRSFFGAMREENERATFT